MTPMATPPVKTQLLSFEEYLKRYDSYEGAKTEWMNGEVQIYTMTNNLQHQTVIFILSVFLTFFLQETKRGKLVQSNIPMRIDEHQAPEPDLMVLFAEHESRLGRYVEGIADIVVEVVSPESDERDYGRKRLLYEAAGVPEYWLIDPIRGHVILHVLHDGLYRQRTVEPESQIRSALLPGFALDEQILWGDVPNLAEVLRKVQAML